MLFDYEQTLRVARVFDELRAERLVYLVGVAAGGTVYVLCADRLTAKAVRGGGGVAMVSALRTTYGIAVNGFEVLDVGAQSHGEGDGSAVVEILGGGLRSLLLGALHASDAP